VPSVACRALALQVDFEAAHLLLDLHGSFAHLLQKSVSEHPIDLEGRLNDLFCYLLVLQLHELSRDFIRV
jgi:hypothetical protein